MASVPAKCSMKSCGSGWRCSDTPPGAARRPSPRCAARASPGPRPPARGRARRTARVPRRARTRGRRPGSRQPPPSSRSRPSPMGGSARVTITSRSARGGEAETSRSRSARGPRRRPRGSRRARASPARARPASASTSATDPQVRAASRGLDGERRDRLVARWRGGERLQQAPARSAAGRRHRRPATARATGPGRAGLPRPTSWTNALLPAPAERLRSVSGPSDAGVEACRAGAGARLPPSRSPRDRELRLQQWRRPAQSSASDHPGQVGSAGVGRKPTYGEPCSAFGRKSPQIPCICERGAFTGP